MTDKQHSIMIVTGEASGDLLAASVIDALKSDHPDYHYCGLGGAALAATGAEMLGNIEDLAVMGIWEVLLNYRKIKRVLKYLEAELASRKPDLLILVDYVEFNLKLARTAKQLGIKVLFFVSPQVWAWRAGRVKKIGEYIDMMAVLFPFEVRIYQQNNIPVSYVGHPMIERVKPVYSPEQARDQFGLSDNHPVIGLFPGSRKSEIKYNLPGMLESAIELKKRYPDAQFLLPVASNLGDEPICSYMTGNEPDIRMVSGYPYDIIQLSDVILSASGTANLEIALLGKPMVVYHRIAALSYFIISRLVTINLFSLVNIIAERKIVKELIQKDATPRNAITEICKILDDGSYRQTMVDDLAEVKHRMGSGGAANNVAKLAGQLLQQP